MSKDTIINRIAHQTGCSRKEVLDILKAFGMLSGGSKQANKEK